METELKKAFREFIKKFKGGGVRWEWLRPPTKYVVLGRTTYEKHLEVYWVINLRGNLHRHTFQAYRGLWDSLSLKAKRPATKQEALAAFVSDSFWGERKLTEEEMVRCLHKLTIDESVTPEPYGFFDDCKYWGFSRHIRDRTNGENYL